MRDDWLELPDADEWEEHRELVDAAAAKRKKHQKRRRRKPKPRKRYMTKKRREKMEKMAEFGTRELYEELSRRGREAAIAKMTPERQQELKEKARARYLLRQSECPHTKFPPRLIRSGPRAGKYWCKQCGATVPHPKLDWMNRLVTVT
jgi:hypothetical protein